jgi:hypothetical protein
MSAVGKWTAVWGEAVFPCEFFPDGTYGCWYGGSMWVGTYTFRGGVLKVSESSGLGSRADWEATISPSRRGFSGRMANGSNFSLRR